MHFLLNRPSICTQAYGKGLQFDAVGPVELLDDAVSGKPREFAKPLAEWIGKLLKLVTEPFQDNLGELSGIIKNLRDEQTDKASQARQKQYEMLVATVATGFLGDSPSMFATIVVAELMQQHGIDKPQLPMIQELMDALLAAVHPVKAESLVDEAPTSSDVEVNAHKKIVVPLTGDEPFSARSIHMIRHRVASRSLSSIKDFQAMLRGFLAVRPDLSRLAQRAMKYTLYSIRFCMHTVFCRAHFLFRSFVLCAQG